MEGFLSLLCLANLTTMPTSLSTAIQEKRQSSTLEKNADNLTATIIKNGISLSQVTHVLSTHKHWDHSDGNAGFLKAIKGLTIVGPKDDQVPSANRHVSNGDTVEVGALQFKCILTPCHTKGSMCYLLSSKTLNADEIKDTDSKNDSQILFTGDTLFTGGCGRFFEGTAADMYDALINKIGALSDDTVVYCGHEYTESNLQFGVHVEPNNDSIRSKLQWAKQVRSSGGCTQPSTLAEERRINVFMRVKEESVQKFAKSTDAVVVMDTLRTSKNSFKPSTL